MRTARVLLCACYWDPEARWTLIQAVKSGLPPPACAPHRAKNALGLADLVYAVGGRSQRNAQAGTAVADLKKKGRAHSMTPQLKAL